VKSAYLYNELNQLTEDDSCIYNYDADGNMTAKINNNTSDTAVYIYDIENKLVQVQKPGMTAQYAYDALGRRMSKTVNGVVTKFRYDGDDLILEMNGKDSVVADYIFGAEIDNPLQMSRGGQNYYYHADGLGSIRALTDDGGNVVQSYNYSVFGKIVDQTGTLENSFTYTGREYDKETGNYYYRARYYDPQNGRFLQEDPIRYNAGDMNLYRYVQNSPINFSDPLGLFCVPLPPKVDKDWKPGKFVMQFGGYVTHRTVQPMGTNVTMGFGAAMVTDYRLREFTKGVTLQWFCCEPKCNSCGNCPVQCNIKTARGNDETKQDWSIWRSSLTKAMGMCDVNNPKTPSNWSYWDPWAGGWQPAINQ